MSSKLDEILLKLESPKGCQHDVDQKRVIVFLLAKQNPSGEPEEHN